MRISYLALKSGFVRYSSIRAWSSMDGFATTQILCVKFAMHKLGPERGHNRASCASCVPDLEFIRSASPPVVPSFTVSGSRTGQAISLSDVLPTNVGDREIERPGQLPPHPIHGIQPRTAAVVLAAHQLHHYLRSSQPLN